MDKLQKYREIVRRVIQEYAHHKPANGQIETEAVIDSEKDHYEVMEFGWQGIRRVHGSIVHLDIQNGKIWIQHNGTDRLIADQLVEAGVPKEDIVLGFHPAHVRQYTGFGVG